MIGKHWCGTYETFLEYKQLEAKVQEAIMASASDDTDRDSKKVFSEKLRKLGVQVTSPMHRIKAFFGPTLDPDEDDYEEESPFARRMGNYLITRGDNGLASIHIAGMLVNNYAWYHPFLTGMITSYQAIRDAMDIVREDANIQRAVLSIDTGGGMVMGVQEAADAIYAASQEKPVVAWTDSAAFSAGYWLMSSASELYTTRMAQVGSIGTIMIHTSVAKAGEKQGIEWTVFRAGEYKALGQEVEQLDEKTREHFSKEVNTVNSYFLNQVSSRRGLSLETTDVWAEGRTFFADRAKALGLTDGIMTSDELILNQQQKLKGSTLRSNLNMKISQDKLDRIEAGEAPAEVLSASELERYNAAIAAGNSPAGEGDGNEGGQPAPGEGDSEGNGEPAAQSSAAGVTLSHADYQDLVKASARLETKLEAREERIAELEASLSQAQENLQSMVPAAKYAVEGLHRLIGAKDAAAATPGELMTQFNAAVDKRAALFPTGQQSAEASVKEETPQGQPTAAQRRIANSRQKSN